MNSDLIFYIANQTFLNEQSIKNSLLFASVNVKNVYLTVNASGLLHVLSGSIRKNKIVFIVGGLNEERRLNPVEIVLKSLRSESDNKIYNIIKNFSPYDNLKKLSCCIIENLEQSIIFLPDNPEKIEMILSDFVLDYLISKYKFKRYA